MAYIASGRGTVGHRLAWSQMPLVITCITIRARQPSGLGGDAWYDWLVEGGMDMADVV